MPNVSVRTNDETTLVFSGLDPAELDQLRDWFSYTKPIGPSMRIMATSASGTHLFCARSAGSLSGPAENNLCLQRAHLVAPEPDS